MRDIPIVVGYDGSDGADTALLWAAAEADRLDAPLRVVHVLEWPTATALTVGAPPYPDEDTYREAEARAAGAALTVARAWPEVTVTAQVRVGATAGTLVAESAHAELLVLGQGHGGVAGLLLGSVGVAVSAHSHCPVVVVRGRPAPGAPVLVGFDGSEPAARALDVAFEAAEARQAPVRVLRAWHPPVPRWRPPEVPDGPEELEIAEHAAVVDALQPWRRRFPAVPVAVDVVADGAAHALAAASARAQLVVVGCRGRGGFAGLLLGSVSQQLLQHAECPVIVVHELPAGHAATAAA